MELFDVYSLYPVEPVRGSGSYVYDAAGTEYLDLYGGHAVISIGHAQPDYVRALSEQAARLGFYSNSVENSLQTTLAEKLGRASGYDDYSLFLCNSGAEANENALNWLRSTPAARRCWPFPRRSTAAPRAPSPRRTTPRSLPPSTARPTWNSYR